MLHKLKQYLLDRSSQSASNLQRDAIKMHRLLMTGPGNNIAFLLPSPAQDLPQDNDLGAGHIPLNTRQLFQSLTGLGLFPYF
jgi:hypothetical protein